MDEAMGKIEKGMKEFFKNPFGSSGSKDKKFKGTGHVIGTKADQQRLAEERGGNVRGDAASSSRSSSSMASLPAMPSMPTMSSVTSVGSIMKPAFQGKANKLTTSKDDRNLPANAAAAVAAVDREARPAEQAAALALARRKAAAAAAAPAPSPPRPAAASSFATAAPVREDDNALLARGGAAATATGADAEVVTALQAALSQVLSTAAGKVAGAESVALMSRVLRNVVSEPTNVKFRRLRLSNAKVQATVMDVPGALELLQAAGFCMLFEDAPDGAEGASEGWLVLPEADPHAFTCAQAGWALLEPFVTSTPPAAAAAVAVVPFGPSNRQTRTFAPADRCAAAVFSPSDAFFRHSADEVREAAAAAKVKLEESRQLTTRAYKEAQAAARRGKPTSATIRVRLPDGIILQGSFAATETVTAVREWVWERLAAPDAFQLFEAGAQHPVADLHPASSDGAAPRPRTVADAGLAPSSLLNLKWEHERASRPGEACLHPELMACVQPLE